MAPPPARGRLLALVLGLAAALPLVARAAPEEDAPADAKLRGFREDWAERDVAVAARVAGLVPPPAGLSVDAWVEKLDGDVREDRGTGFGGRRLRLAIYGGYSTTWLDAFVHRGEVVLLRTRTPIDPPLWERLRERLHDAWGKRGVADDEGHRFEFASEERIAAAAAAVRKALGEPPKTPLVARPSDERPRDDALLDDPLADLTYGTSCSVDGGPPRGREATERLVARRDADGARRALRSLNPEARVYAIEALRRMAEDGVELTDADRKAIDAVLDLDVPIRCCSGCELYDAPAREALRKD